MTRKELFLSTFKGYPSYDSATKALSLETLIAQYARWQKRYSVEEYYSVEDKIEEIKWMVEADLITYEEQEEYEICTILRDVLEIL